jgi:hypothetical protein
MDYIKLAEEFGIKREVAIKIYKAFNGGYYIKLYYSKPPFLYSLKNWPRLYFNQKIYYIFNSNDYNIALNLLIFIDIYSIYKMSSNLINYNIDINTIKSEVSYVFDRIENISKERKIFPYPEFVDLDFNTLNKYLDIFGYDLTNKRINENNIDIIELLNDIAYESETMNVIKIKYPWAKSIKRENSIKALATAGFLDEFLRLNNEKFKFIALSRSLYFDELLINEKNIFNTLIKIQKITPSNTENQKFKEEYNKIINTLMRIANYY